MRQLRELCDLVGGQLSQDSDIAVTGAASIARVQQGDITFVTTPKYLEAFEASEASAAVAGIGLESSKPLIIVEDPEKQFAQIARQFRRQFSPAKIGISPAAHVSETAVIADDVDIYPGAFIGEEVVIGSGSVIHANVTIMPGSQVGRDVEIFPSAVLYPGTMVGDRSIIHAGVVLGAYGFGYKTIDGRHWLSAQLGNVVIEADVEIGANTTIDRGTYDSTVIGEGSKLDDQVMIGHNCQIGKHNILCSQVGIAGSTNTGDYVVMGGQVGIGDHLNIGNGVRLAAKTGVMQDIEDQASMAGIPAVTARNFLKQAALVAKLSEMRQQLKSLTREVERLTEQDNSQPSQDAA